MDGSFLRSAGINHPPVFYAASELKSPQSTPYIAAHSSKYIKNKKSP
jgi:hypothetical protein